MVELPPQQNPQHREQTAEQERPAPAERQMRHQNNGGCQHRANGKTHARPACGDWPLFTREPVRNRFGVGRCGRRFGAAHEKAQNRQLDPASGTGVQHTHDRPDRSTDQETELQADHVDQPATQWLKNGIRRLKCRDDVRILFGGHIQAGFEFRSQ